MLLKPIFKFCLALGLAALLSVTTVIFGALPMRAVRKAYGRLAYWTGFILVSIALAVFVSIAYGLLVLSLAIAVGVYTEIEEHGGSVFSAGFVAILAAMGSTAFGVGAWMYRTKAHLIEEARNQLEPLAEKITAMNSGAGISADTLIQQIPSGLMIGFIAALAVALIGERRMLGWLGLSVERSADDKRLGSFRAPDAFIWLTIAAVFGAFYHHGNELFETISINALNVLAVIYFFQGLAIVAHAFRVFRVGPFWQWLWYMVLVLQLFLLVSLIGFADFWVEFRTRLTRKPAETKRSF